ncbi:T9SS type A sorting domain-containing protein [Fibrella arboris]|uniref:Ig-like domain-containing protein n=1 Tax=Fibrella arboris TaxID=3242486 RepID=UPI003521A3B7
MDWSFTRRYLAGWMTILVSLAAINLANAQAINVTSNISPATNLCSNSTVSLTFSTTGVFTAGNIFSLQQSDENGLFSASPVVVASLASAPTSASTLTVSGNLGTVTYGANYRFRVVSTTPVRTSNQTPSAVIIGTNTPTPGQSGLYTFCPNSGSQPITASGTGVIEWYNGSAAAAPVVATGGTYNVPTTSTPVTYYVTQTINGCKSAKTAVTVTTSAPTGGPSFTPPAAFCPGQGPAQLIASPTSTGVASTIQWVSSSGTQTGASITTPQTTGTYTYTISQFDSRGCAGSSTTVATVTVNAAPTTAPSTNLPSSAYCSDNVPGPLSANLSAGATSVKWYNLTDNTTATTSTIPAPSSTKQYQISQFIGSCEGPKSSAFTVAVTQKPGDPALNATGNGPFCQNSGTNATQTITATGLNLEWFASNTSTPAVSTGSTFVISTAGGNVPVYFRQVVNGCASNRISATITINPTPSSAPSFTPPATYCADNTPGTLTATATGGATSVKWYNLTDNTTTTTASISAPTSTKQYQVSQLIGSCEGPKSTAFTVTVNPKPGDPALNATGNGPFCQNSGTGATQTITATGQSIEWFASASAPTATTTGSTFTISTAGGNVPVYFRQVVNGCPSNRITATVTVNSLPGLPTSALSRTYCAGESPAPLSATGQNLLWYTTASGGTGVSQAPTPSTAASNVGTPQQFYVSQTVNNCEGGRQSLSVTVKRKPGLPTNISSPAFCQNSPASSLSALAESGASLIWVNNGVETTTPPAVPNTVARTYTYQVLQIADGCRSDQATVSVTVKQTPGQPTLTAYSLCFNRESRPLQASGSDLKYYDSNDLLLGATAPSPSTSQVTTVVYKVSQSIDGCEGPKATYSVPVYAIPANPTFTQPRDYCAEDAATSIVASGQGLLWYTTTTGGSGTGQAPTPSTAAANVGTPQQFFVTQTINGCESLRQQINVTVKRKPALPSTTTNVEFCQTYSAPTLTATPENNASIIWVVDGRETATGPTPQNDAVRTYTYQVLQELSGCRSDRVTVTARVKSTPGLPGITPFQLCQFAPGRALQANGSDLKYYDANNSPLGSTSPVINTDVARTFLYRVSQSTEGCEGPKIDYSVVVQPKPAPPATQAVTYCLESSNNPDQPKQTVQPLSAQGQNLRWYFVDDNAFPEGFVPTPAVTNTYAVDYRVTQTVNNCVSDKALLRVTVQANPAPVVSSSLVTYCRNDVARPLEATGPGLRWFDPNGQLLPASEVNPTPPTANATKGGEKYQVYSVSSGGCVSPRSTIRLVINTNPTLGLLGSTTVNYGQSASLKLLFTSSPPYAYTLTDGTSGIANDTLSSVSVKPLQTTTYRVASVSNVCGSGLPGNPATATVAVTIPTISTQALTAGTVCAGTGFAVTFTTTGVFNAGNAFKVQVADTTSKNYVDVSEASAGPSLNALLPATLKGGPYFVRVLATNPGAEVPGLRSPTVLTVRGLPSAVLTGMQDVYEGSPASLSIALGGDGPWAVSYSYTVDGTQQTTSTFQTNANPHILSVVPPKTASYFLTAVSNNCSSAGPVSGTALVTVLPLLAVENPLLNTVSLYPVPTQHLLTVAIDLPLTSQAPAQLTLRDLTGMPVLNRQTDTRQTVLDLSQQPAGLYLLNVQVGEHRTVRKIMKL